MQITSYRHLPSIVVLCSTLIVTSASGPFHATAAEPNTLTAEELADGWIMLFDGQTFFGWRPADEADWAVRDGAISVGKGKKGLLCTTSQFGDYRLKVDFRSAPGTNSGVFLRTSPTPTDVATRCYELNIADTDANDFPTGSFVYRQAASDPQDSPDWQSFDVTADGPHFVVKLDGRTVLDYTDPEPQGRGYIGLQFNRGQVEFRNIKLKPLRTESLFNGEDLTGWKTYPEMQSEFSVTPEGWLRVQNGKGQLETLGAYEDFTMQLEAFVNGQGINSGIFFRCIPGEEMNGYESQIQNAFLDGDRTKPEDCGTGGIFRRQEARRIVADDLTWFHKTLHVDDCHMAVWVNGYQVSDWSDRRPADANPRRGLRLEAGTIMIQGHDPTTDFSFRNLRISELPPRR